MCSPVHVSTTAYRLADELAHTAVIVPVVLDPVKWLLRQAEASLTAPSPAQSPTSIGGAEPGSEADSQDMFGGMFAETSDEDAAVAPAQGPEGLASCGNVAPTAAQSWRELFLAAEALTRQRLAGMGPGVHAGEWT